MIQKLRPYLFTLILLSGFASLPLWGQIEYCIDFESLEQGFYGPNNGYEAGDFFFSQHEVDVSMAAFNFISFLGATVTDDPIVGDQIEGQYSILNSGNLFFDFTTTNQNVVNVCFDFVNLAAEIDLGVNGQDIILANGFSEIPQEIAPGVMMELNLNNTDLESGTVCLIGTIENLTIGGLELALDNVCFVPVGSNECQITEIIVEPHPCTPNGIFYVDIEVHANNPGNDGFTVRGNGVVYGSYSYDEPFITIGPLAGDGETSYEFVVIDNQNEDCQLGYDLGPVDCESGACVIDELHAYTLNCVEETQYNILVDFVPVNVTNDFFDVYINDELFGFYSYEEDLPLVIEEYQLDSNSEGIVITICDNDNPDCCQSVDVEIFPCSNEGCISFEYVEEAFYGDPNNVLPGEVFYAEQEVEFSLDSLLRPGASPVYKYVVVRHTEADPGFNFEAAVGQYLYNDGISTSIDFTGYTADVHTVTMDFIHDGGIYNLAVNGQDTTVSTGFFESGTYDLGNGVILEVVITDTTDDFVQGTLTFAIEDGNIETLLIGGTGLGFDNLCMNPVCELGEMIVEAGDCNPNGVFSVFVDFEYQHTVADSFALRLDGELYGRFAYADLPIEIGPFVGPTEVMEFEAFDLEWDGCFTGGFLEPVNCNCPIFNFELLQTPQCLNGGYFFPFYLGVEGAHGESFTITNSEGISVSFPYSNTGYYEGGFDGIYNTDVLTICDNAFPDCCIEVELEPNCGGSDCEFSNMEWFATDCDDFGNFYIKVDFDFSQLSAGFLLYVNEELYQDFNLSDLPLEIGPFDGDGETAYVVGIQLADPNSNCYIQETFGPVDCDTGVDCGISDVIVEPYDCNDGQFMVDLAFESQNTGPLGYYVFVSGQIFGPFSYNETYVTLGPLVGDGETFYNFTILDIADPGCFGFYELGTFDCNQECGIYDLVVETLECNPNGTYGIVIDFEYQSPGNDFFDVYDANGEIIGFYPLGELPVTIESFAGNGGTVDFLQVCINDQPNCCTTTSFAAPDCTGDPCQITEVFAEAYDCENGTFLVDLVVSVENPGEHGFTVLGNGQIYGTFEYSSSFITLGPFEGDGETVYEFIVVDNDNESCNNYTEIGPIDCPDCQISDLQYNIECHSGPFFTLHLDFNHDNPESDYFDLKIGDQFIDEFLYSALPLTIELPLEMGMGESLTVCDHEVDNCCTTIDFFLPCCSIRDMVVEAHDCEDDGTFYVDLDFIHGNTGDFFTLVYGPENGPLTSEVYSYEDLPLTVGPFDGDNSSSWYFQATDESLFCQMSTTLEPVYCDNESCLEFEDFSGTFYGPNTGYNVGDEIGEENGILMTYETFPGDECNCYVFVVDANTFPAFSGGTGHIIALFNSGIGFDFTTANQVLSSITFDYYFDGNEVKISVNGTGPVVAASPEDLPSDIAPGVTLMVDTDNGTMTFTGAIETLTIYGAGNLLLDNGCFETTTPEPVDVWPGDANLDNIASHYDLLNIGVAYQAIGPARNSNTIEWAPLAAEQWEEEFTNGINFKHADCNGDGVINADDREAILQNYGQQHGAPETITPLPATDLDPAIFLDAPDELPNSLVFEIPVVLGTEDIPVEDIYGIAFEIEVDPNLIDLATLEVEYPVSWLGEPDVNLISLHQKNLNDGTLEVAMVRTDHNNVSGFGPIVILRGIIDDIAGIHETEIRTNAIKAISVNEQQLPLRNPAAMLTVNNTTNDPIGKIDLMRNIRVYPNPTSGMVNIDIKYQLPIEQVDILDPTGKQVAPTIYNTNEVSLEALPAGMYMLRIHLGGYVITERVVKTIR